MTIRTLTRMTLNGPEFAHIAPYTKIICRVRLEPLCRPSNLILPLLPDLRRHHVAQVPHHQIEHDVERHRKDDPRTAGEPQKVRLRDSGRQGRRVQRQDGSRSKVREHKARARSLIRRRVGLPESVCSTATLSTTSASVFPHGLLMEQNVCHVVLYYSEIAVWFNKKPKRVCLFHPILSLSLSLSNFLSLSPFLEI